MIIEDGLETIYNIKICRLRINFILNKVFLVQFTILLPYSTDFCAHFIFNVMLILCRFLMRRKQTFSLLHSTNS